MKKPVRLVLVITIAALLAVGWTWRYVTLNQYYDNLDNGDYLLYQAGELVPFEDDGNDKSTDLNGYYIRVDGFETRDYDDYLEDTGISLPKREAEPDKLVLVKVTLLNESCDPNPVIVTDILLHGIDSVAYMDAEVLVAANPILDGNTGIALEPGTQCQLIFPFALYKHTYSHRTWNNLDNYKLYLQVTNSLTTKDIRING